MYKKPLKTLFAIVVFCTFSLFFKTVGIHADTFDELSKYLYIETDNPAFLDSLRNLNRMPIPIPCVTEFAFDTLSPIYGSILLTDVNTIRRGSLDSTRFKYQFLHFFENGSIYIEYEIIAFNDSLTYCKRTDCIGSDCDSLCESAVIVNVLNNNQILFNSSTDLNVEIYKPYRIRQDYDANFLLTGSNTNYIYNFNLEPNQPYIVVFRNTFGKVVNIKKIIGI